MDFAQQQRNPGKHLVGITFVVLLHVLMGWALVKGLHRDALQAIQEELDVVIVEEPKIEEPPPPPEELPPPPDVNLPPPPPSQIPPPEVKVEAPVQTNAISAQIAPPTVVNDKPAPPPPKVDTPPPPPAAPVTAAVACSNFGDIREFLADKFVQVADKEDFAGKGITSFDMTMQITLGPAGEIKEISARSSTNAAAARAMMSVVTNGVKRLKCAGQGRDIPVLVPLGFTLTD